MNTPLITWSVIVGLFVVILLVRLFHAAAFCAKGRHRIIEFGHEREEFFAAGDPLPSKAQYLDNDEYCEDI